MVRESKLPQQFCLKCEGQAMLSRNVTTDTIWSFCLDGVCQFSREVEYEIAGTGGSSQ